MSFISEILLDWYGREGRDLPWRRTRDPYRIWLSEVILQQTRVAQGMNYYLRFTERYPDVHSLAAASEDEVLKLWQGLGYYSRARNLHAAARQVVAQFGGVFPVSVDDVRSLRGVGDYTAAAICSAAYDAPYAVLDGNVFRVLSRLFDVDTPIDTSAGKKAFAELAQSQLDTVHPAQYNQAIMDFGALQCTPAQPRCADCPLTAHCLALAAETVTLRPVKQGRAKVRGRWFNYLHITCGDNTLLGRRGAGDIWQGLYEFPLIETPGTADFAELARTPQFKALLGDRDWRLLRSVAVPKHQLSHQTLHAVFHRIECAALPDFPSVPTATLGDYAVPRLLDRYLLHSSPFQRGI
ncbi:A/G-specific adenine glycosylase [uncultured Alistipes sp.]|jgi:A/G-specific adenine glycosylase|uniref:A/G-specific adenine glycosylase n=1 Tax=uncultured Alistipes sp. TaxID=538949 RepID=UPI0025D510E9|nr:A/G-specific adenine glycosylase [uncultured Alistipes sp.]